jgi:nucleoside phosphorylase
MCGIAGAVPCPAKSSDHVRLGDIVASTEGVLQYDFERVSEGGVEMRPKTRLPSRRMVEAANLLQSDELRGLRPWDQYIAQATSALGDGWERPHEESDLLCEFEGSRPRDYLVRILRKIGVRGRMARYHPIPHPSDPIRRLGFPRIFHGVIASANRLQKDPAKRDLLRAQLRARAIEMEGSGIADAAYELDAEFLVVRGTCDYCNGDKNDLWHNYAAIVAAAYLKAFLEVLPPAPLLTGQGGGPNTSPLNVVPVHVAHEQAIAESAATDEAVAASVDSIVQLNINQFVGGALEDEARRRISSIREAIDAWEFGRASALGTDLEVWLEERERLLSKPVLREVLEILVKVELARSAREPGDDSPVDTRRAEFYLSRLKDASRD